MTTKRWTFSAGIRPHTITVFERKAGGPLYARAWDPTLFGGKGGFHRISLGHRDRRRAKKYAVDQAGKLQQQGVLDPVKVTLAYLFALYEQHRTPRKSIGKQKDDHRRVELFTRYFGGTREPFTIALQQWESFIDARSSGAITARGVPVPLDGKKKRRPLRARAVEIDCDWLKGVFNWAVSWRVENGTYLMRENPLRGFETPQEKNPNRPVANKDRFAAIRAVSDRHTMEYRREGRRWETRSYLSELLDLAHWTGRRISAICSLRYSDLRLDKTSDAPFGAISWPADTDKEGYASVMPISPEVRKAIDRILAERPGVGSVPLFPMPTDPTQPIMRYLAAKWLRAGEVLAGLDSLPGSMWHAYRRGWATEREHFPDVDVAAAGGWKSLNALKQSYQHADSATILKVVLDHAEDRNAG